MWWETTKVFSLQKRLCCTLCQNHATIINHTRHFSSRPSAAMKNVSFKNSNLLYKKKPRNIENDVLQQDFRWDYRFLRIYSPCPLSFLLIQTHYCRWEDSIESCDAAKMKLFTFFSERPQFVVFEALGTFYLCSTVCVWRLEDFLCSVQLGRR